MGKTVRMSRLIPLISATLDEVEPFARAHALECANGLDVQEAASRIARQMGKPFEPFLFGEGTRRERRAALLRIMARAAVLLALDDLERGQRAAAADAKALDDLGNVVRPMRVRKVK